MGAITVKFDQFGLGHESVGTVRIFYGIPHRGDEAVLCDTADVFGQCGAKSGVRGFESAFAECTEFFPLVFKHRRQAVPERGWQCGDVQHISPRAMPGLLLDKRIDGQQRKFGHGQLDVVATYLHMAACLVGVAVKAEHEPDGFGLELGVGKAHGHVEVDVGACALNPSSRHPLIAQLKCRDQAQLHPGLVAADFGWLVLYSVALPPGDVGVRLWVFGWKEKGRSDGFKGLIHQDV